ncbi:GGDEF domain-containing protein [Photobacterium salinisoli]|uniref:GGDEF domain-containing protein n=1 Tax=Photobacterium salinisoli TaxID=1616783 RepID=UPI000EA3579E|nr:sensor domain-containing diguanylate cyclase [Photobacterium salinisoli]
MHTEYSESENVIRRLHQITQSYDKGFDFQIHALIQLGLERFDLDIGILAQVEGDTYTIRYCICPEYMPLMPGNQFEFGMTYCAVTCESDGVVAVEHVGNSDILGSHPAYRHFGLESYIAIPIHVGGVTWGTLNFSSPAPYPRAFKDIDIDSLQLMASWIEVEMVRRMQENQLRELNVKLKQMASTDPLTKLMNRRAFTEKLLRSVNHFRRSKQPQEAALLLVDIDYFKELNDTYGHLLGDKVLIEFAKVLTENLRSYDIGARYGGKVFVIWLVDTERSGIEVVCDRLMSGLDNLALVDEKLTASVGICHVKTRQVDENALSQFVKPAQIMDAMVARADQALCQAKANGRAKTVFCSEEPVYLDTLS